MRAIVKRRKANQGNEANYKHRPRIDIALEETPHHSAVLNAAASIRGNMRR